MDRSTFIETLTGYLQQINPDREVSSVAPDANLHDAGLIDSLRMVELVLFLEKATGRPIPVERHEPRVFHTLDKMYAAFGQATAEG